MDDYDFILKSELEKRLKRPAKDSEIINADNDSDLVSETLYQLFLKLEARIKTLENEQNKVKY